MPNYVVARDLGTTGNKATLHDREDRLVGASFQAYKTEYAHTGWAEQNPEDWWDAVCQSTRHLLSKTGVNKNDIACITFGGQMMGAVPLAKNARPLRNAIIWADQRALDQERWIGGSLGQRPASCALPGGGGRRHRHKRSHGRTFTLFRESSAARFGRHDTGAT